MGDGERRHHLDQRPQPLAPEDDGEQKRDVVVAEKDVLDAGRDKPPDDLQHRRASTGERDLRRTVVEGKLALAALGGDKSEVPRCRIDVLKQCHAIAELAVRRTAPRHRYQNVGVGGLCRSRSRRTSLTSG